jgi:hypothetical protein
MEERKHELKSAEMADRRIHAHGDSRITVTRWRNTAHTCSCAHRNASLKIRAYSKSIKNARRIRISRTCPNAHAQCLFKVKAHWMASASQVKVKGVTEAKDPSDVRKQNDETRGANSKERVEDRRDETVRSQEKGGQRKGKMQHLKRSDQGSSELMKGTTRRSRRGRNFKKEGREQIFSRAQDGEKL